MTSVIIPYIDEHDYLLDALRSARAQSSPVTEIIVVCNHPVRPTAWPAIPEGPAPVRWLHEPVAGAAHARNAGLRASTGEWIQFLDVDDLLRAGKIGGQLEGGEADVLLSPHLFRKQNGAEVPSAWQPDDLWSGLLNSALGSTSSWLFRREVLVAAGGWSPEWSSHQEYELLFRLMARGCRVRAVARRDTIVRQRLQGSITVNTTGIRAAEGIRLREQIRSYLDQQGLLTPTREHAFRQYVFRQLRGLYRVDEQQALAIYSSWFSGIQFRPEPPVPGWYVSLFRLLGFSRAEQWLKVYRSMRDRYFPFLPKND